MIENLEKRPAAEIGRLVAAGSLDSIAVAEFFLDRIERDRENPSFILVTRERAFAEAGASSKRHREGRAAGPLDGVPIAWKDLVDMAGTRTTAGSALYAESPAKEKDAPIVAHLSAAGLVALGKTNLSEFAFSALGLNPHFGTPRNPRDSVTPRVAGGSSSGAAVAVAGGLAPCAIGSDTGGSIRAPAGFCGIVGFKTSEGRIDKRGVFPLSHTLDTIGPIAHTVEDCVLIDMALRGQSTTPVRPLDLKGIEFVVPDKSGIDDAEAEVAANLETTMKRLAAAGAKVTSRPIPEIGAMRALSAQYGSFVAIEAYAEHRAVFDSADAKRMDRRVVKRALGGRVPERDVTNLHRGRETLIAALVDQLKGALLVLPATPMTAPAIGPLERDDELFRVTNLRAIHYTFLGNLFRMCGLALPSGTDAAGLPTGVQFLAPGGDDDRLLSVGLSMETALSR
ncbi:MAG TPA: amidase family protein [Roseiarcus sp.]|jgi:aspartyl-tRNA(Asn)/glutamyl-tRNA(Gln) amidotransferase subunit A|nr:amidase family protein [Roseiarcus sp.]